MNRRFLLSALFALITVLSFGQGYQVQSKYFVYLQTEPAQPFYIKIGGQQIDANASGYLILPQLKDGDYKLIVGFPQTKAPEQAFNFRIDSKDKGYLIKDYGTEGWGLFDLQTMAVQKAIKGGVKEEVAVKTSTTPPPQQPQQQPQPQIKETKPVVKEVVVAAEGVSDFTKILSQAANDPSLLEKPKPAPVEEKVIENKPKEENAVVVAPVAPSPVQKDEQPKTAATSGNDSFKLLTQSQSDAGVTLVYDNRTELGQVDPITIFIPKTPKAVLAKPAETSVPAVQKAEEVITAEKEAEKPTVHQAEESAVASATASAVKSTNEACKSVADEEDFLKLRRIMASESNDDSMIAQAEKAFKSKCYTTAQVKYLSSMFLSNAGKFNFYKAAYGHVADKENFSSLSSELKDSNYLSRFNSLVNQ